MFHYTVTPDNLCLPYPQTLTSLCGYYWPSWSFLPLINKIKYHHIPRVTLLELHRKFYYASRAEYVNLFRHNGCGLKSHDLAPNHFYLATVTTGLQISGKTC